VLIGSVSGSFPYSGPAPTYDFESAAPFTGGFVGTGSVTNVRAQPFGSTGNYASVSRSNGPGILDLSSFGSINKISFLWGSVDSYNFLDVLSGSTVLASFTGSQVTALANGNQTDPATNPIVTLSFTGDDRDAADALRFRSNGNAFEFDNVAVSALPIPEPAMWAMMIGGLGLVGGAMRRRRPMGTIALA
jgi:hypothetical protein